LDELELQRQIIQEKRKLEAVLEDSANTKKLNQRLCLELDSEESRRLALEDELKEVRKAMAQQAELNDIVPTCYPRL
jgi:hypothetical protein